MNGIMYENVIVKDYIFDKPLINKIDLMSEICIKDCHNKYFDTIDHICVYHIKLTITGNIELFNLTVKA